MDEGIIAYTITTGNGSVSHRRQIGRIETTPKGIFFMNLTPLSVWAKTGSGIYHWRDDPIMEDEEITEITFDTAYGPAPNIEYRSGIVYHETGKQAYNRVYGLSFISSLYFLQGYISCINLRGFK